MKIGRFVVDSHVHAQRFAAGAALAEREQEQETGQRREWEALSGSMGGLIPYDNTARLEYDMNCYRVDMCVLLPAFGMTDELNREIVERSPERYVAFCGATDFQARVRDGEEPWTIEGLCAALDEELSTGAYVGIGEGMHAVPQPVDPRKPPAMETVIGNMLAIMEVAQRHGVAVGHHTGAPMGYDLPYSTNFQGASNYNPLWAHDLASAFPDVPLILEHGGIQGWWSERIWEDCLHVAAGHDNVYLECGLWWTELFDKPLADPNIGPEKLMWGTDWGASMGFHSQPGRYPPSYPVQVRSEGIVRHQVDYWGWSLREMLRLRIPQDDMNLIVGGNAARVFGLELPHRRLLRPVQGRANEPMRQPSGHAADRSAP